MAKHLILGTAGHIDHGKTALIKAMTGIDCDTHKEEKERGITINLGFSHLELPSGNSLGIIDVPGHKDFIRTMVAGAYGIDLVLLVVAADEGIMPQTREHVNIIGMLGIKYGIVALNKIDLVDEETAELATLEILEMLENTSLRDSPVIGVSSVNGTGVAELIRQIDQLANVVPEKNVGSIFRMYIDRVFNIKGFGLVVTGSVLNGEIHAGDDIYLLPSHHDKVKVKNIERHGLQIPAVRAGERAALNISGLKYEDFERGMLLSNKRLPETSLTDATLQLFSGSPSLKSWSQVLFHTGTFTTKARMHLIDKEKLKGGEEAIVQIHLDKPAIMLKGDSFIVRNSSNDLTLGGGMIVDTMPLHHRRKTEKLVTSLKEMVNASTSDDNLPAMIGFELRKKSKPVFLKELSSQLEIDRQRIVEACDHETEKQIQIYPLATDSILVNNETENLITGKIIDEINLHHQKNSLLESGLDQKELASKLNLRTPAETAYLEKLLEKLTDTGRLKKSGKTWVKVDHQVTIDQKTLEQLDWIEKTILDFGMQKPLLTELETLALRRNISKGQLKMLLSFLVKNDRIFFNGEDLIHNDIINQARKSLLTRLASKADGINEKEFRELIGGTKKIIQLLVDRFIAEGVIEKRTFYLIITDKGRQKLQ